MELGWDVRVSGEIDESFEKSLGFLSSKTGLSVPFASVLLMSVLTDGQGSLIRIVVGFAVDHGPLAHTT